MIHGKQCFLGLGSRIWVGVGDIPVLLPQEREAPMPVLLEPTDLPDETALDLVHLQLDWMLGRDRRFLSLSGEIEVGDA